MQTDTRALHESSIQSLPLIQRGKVRDVYAVGDDHMLIITTDRISAFDVILPDPIPGKGAILTATSNFWFDYMGDVIANHISDIAVEDVLSDPAELEQAVGRGIVVKKLKPLPVEAIVRGYLIGSGWKDYQANGAVCGIKLPSGLQQAQQLPHPIYTPSTKADIGDHDENVDFDHTVRLIGADYATRIRDVSLDIYTRAAKFARGKGIIIADTKFEFGTDNNGELMLIDEVLTSDSSRFWPESEYQVGISPPSFDKQIVRDYLETLDWDKRAPGPVLPLEIADKTAAKYMEAYTRLTS